MDKMIPRVRTEIPKEYMVSAPVDLQTKNRIIEIANERYAGIEARVVRAAINGFLKRMDEAKAT